MSIAVIVVAAGASVVFIIIIFVVVIGGVAECVCGGSGSVYNVHIYTIASDMKSN